MTERELIADIEKAIVLYEQNTDQPANRTRQIIERHGHVRALARLMVSPDLQQDFKALRDAGLLEYSFEALVVSRRELFTDEVVAAAEWRLDSKDDLL